MEMNGLNKWGQAVKAATSDIVKSMTQRQLHLTIELFSTPNDAEAQKAVLERMTSEEKEVLYTFLVTVLNVQPPERT